LPPTALSWPARIFRRPAAVKPPFFAGFGSCCAAILPSACRRFMPSEILFRAAALMTHRVATPEAVPPLVSRVPRPSSSFLTSSISASDLGALGFQASQG